MTMATAATTTSAAKDYAAARRFMVDGQIRTNKVTDERLIEALVDIPRERFVPSALEARAYLDDDLPVGNGRYLMEPMVLARLIQSLHVQPGDRVLVVGAAGGYSAALLARLGATVTALESDSALGAAARAALSHGRADATLVAGPLQEGYAQGGPYAAILIEGAVAEVPARLLEQLKQEGKLATVLRDNNVTSGRAVLVTRGAAGTVGTRILFDANTPLLPGFEPAPAFTF
ncbi:protein-L-isoaspartate O-methyltransferase family protein [Dongia rigui]|uniref:Protein-L-isoaspartate O-methyltransferase n=1 Tax=Dongia rigui TaxID=940149 RepID=A0ABU5E3J3_9PROT|nr:protein-L-isoaspartate O-methyltransferase [Dongia rigui]MDY0874178.1 protein-L-isoaspartate O-methyltransferase [Dongia rigui]